MKEVDFINELEVRNILGLPESPRVYRKNTLCYMDGTTEVIEHISGTKLEGLVYEHDSGVYTDEEGDPKYGTVHRVYQYKGKDLYKIILGPPVPEYFI